MPVTLTLIAALAWPQEATPRERPGAATVAETGTARAAAREWFAARHQYDCAAPQERATAAAAALAGSQGFDAAVQELERRRARPFLLDDPALAAVFGDVFVPTADPLVRGAVVAMGEPPVARNEYVPQAYDRHRSHATVLLLAGAGECVDLPSAQEFVRATWLAPAARDGVIVVAPVVPPDMDLDATDGGSDARNRRIGAVLAPLGETWRTLHCDRDRVVLDCGRGASAFGLRLAAAFPDRFAGVVLRWPVRDDALRHAALGALPVLLVRCAATADACAALHARREATAPGTCRIITPRDDYPFGGDAGIAQWVREQRRDFLSPRVVVAPIDDRFRRNRWVQINEATPLAAAAPGEEPLLLAELDRAQNRIEVTTRGVQSFTLLLGPALVDVRDFTLVVDGRAQQVSLQPSQQVLVDQLTMRFDPGARFTASHRVDLR